MAGAVRPIDGDDAPESGRVNHGGGRGNVGNAARLAEVACGVGLLQLPTAPDGAGDPEVGEYSSLGRNRNLTSEPEEFAVHCLQLSAFRFAFETNEVGQKMYVS